MFMRESNRQYTAHDIQNFPDDGNRYEVIAGKLFASPAPTFDHQVAVQELFRIVHAYVRLHDLGHTAASPADIRFSERNAVQPDLFVVPLINGRRPREWTDVKTLLLACEVLSPRTTRADRIVKRALFRSQRVPEYWIVDLAARTFERSTPDMLRAEILFANLEWMPEGAPEPLVINLPAYFASVLDQ